MKKNWLSIPLLCNEIKQLFYLKAIHKNINFAIHFCDNFPQEILTDRERLKQVLSNLVQNAIKYTKKGGLSLSFSFAELNQQHTGDDIERTIKLIIEVKDTGIGIQPKNLKKIFESFSRQAGMEQTHMDGPGLGLSITKKITILMGGSITVKSIPGEGSVFTLCFPKMQARFTEGDELSNSLDSKSAENESIQKKNIETNTEKTYAYSNKLIEFLMLQEQTTWVNFKIKQPVNEVKTFAKSIIDAGKEFKNDDAINYGKELLSTIETFDIKKMLHILNKYQGLIEAIKINT